MKQLVKTKFVAALLGVHPHDVYQLVRTGGLPAIRVGARRLRFDLDAVEAWLHNPNKSESRPARRLTQEDGVDVTAAREES